MSEFEGITPFDEYVMTLEQIGDLAREVTNVEDLEHLFDEMEYELKSAVSSGELTSEELEDLFEFANNLVDDIEHDLRFDSGLDESKKTLRLSESELINLIERIIMGYERPN